MDILHIATLIRVLFVFVMLGLMVVAGALIARRRPSNGRPDALPDASPGPSVVQHTQRYPASLGSRHSNDADVEAPAHTQSRAA